MAESRVAVTVFEARDRLGGRVWTDTALGVPLDLGASWIRGVDGNPLTEIADRLDVSRTPTDYENVVVRNTEAEILATNRIPTSFIEVAEIEHEFAADVEDLAPAAIEEGEEFDGDDVLFPGGYSQLLDEFAGPYDTRLATPVSSVRLTGEGVELVLAEDQPTFDAALVTVPLGVPTASDIAFEPPLPEANQKAIERLGMGLPSSAAEEIEALSDKRRSRKPWWHSAPCTRGSGPSIRVRALRA